MSQLDSTEINFLKYCYFRLYHEQNKYCALRTCLLPILIYALPLNKGCGFTQLSLQVPRAGATPLCSSNKKQRFFHFYRLTFVNFKSLTNIN